MTRQQPRFRVGHVNTRIRDGRAAVDIRSEVCNNSQVSHYLLGQPEEVDLTRTTPCLSEDEVAKFTKQVRQWVKIKMQDHDKADEYLREKIVGKEFLTNEYDRELVVLVVDTLRGKITTATHDTMSEY